MTKSKEDVQAEIERVAETVDTALKDHDENDDGYISYGEFHRYTHDIIIRLVCQFHSVL